MSLIHSPRPVARGGGVGGGGGRTTPPPVAHPKDFVPPFSNFVPPLEYVCPRVGAFFKLMTSRGQCPRGGGAPGVPPIQVQTPPPHLAGWLRACSPV